MTYNIRPMTITDIDAVYAIETEVHVAPWSRSILNDCVLVGYHCLVFEVVDTNNLMFGGYMISRQSNNCCHILNFCIAKSLQSKGYGRQFLQHVLNNLASAKHLDHVILEVRTSNKVAINLYKSMGFQQVEIKSNYYKDNNKIEDAILFKKILSA